MGEILINNLAGIISAVGVILAAWWTYNQYRHNAEADTKKEAARKAAEKESETMKAITGRLWGILAACRADRVYLIQPHPLGGVKYITVTAEVCHPGVSGIRDAIQSMPIDTVKDFADALKAEDWLWYQDDGRDVDDKRFRALLLMHGCKSTAAGRVTDGKQWIGSVMVGYIEREEIGAEALAERREMLLRECEVIGVILPPVE